MPYQVKDIVKLMEDIAPSHLAESWDNVGLLIGSHYNFVKRIMITLDITADVIKEAVEKEADLIISHHPVIFQPIKTLTDSTVIGCQISTLIRSGISVYAAHTNFDKAKGGTDDTLAELLGLEDVRPLTMEDEHPSFGRIGKLPRKLALEDYLKEIKRAVNADKIDYIGQAKKEIEIVASCAGAGGDFIQAAGKAGADLFITGEAKYHEMLPLLDSDMAIAVLGHYTSELPGMDALKLRLQNRFNALQYDIEVIPSEDYGKCFRRLEE